ncbi:MAG TPA: alkaline phosphatase family protein [Stellaceae bacterium]|nr:alkaline phosphatase family protein [Stellaceae bacterium]
MTKALIVVFDGLRPDLVRPELTPNIWRFRAEGASFAKSRAVFPTETRVNAASLVTAALPVRHGIVANQFFDAAAQHFCNCGRWQDLELLEQRLGRPLLGVPDLGAILARSGRSLAVIGTGTTGCTRILHTGADLTGELCLSLHGLDASRPRAVAEALVTAVGPLPSASVPAFKFLAYAVTAYIDYVVPSLDPDVTILWLSEPDTSFHYRGLGSPESLRALSEADAQFGRLLEFRDRACPDLLVAALSDHGHVGLSGERLRLGERLQDAGFAVGAAGEAAVAVDGDLSGGIWVREHDPETIARLLAWLQSQPWCGALAARDSKAMVATLSHDALGIDHPRAADIVFDLVSDSGPGEWGITGRCRHNSNLPAGGGLHGGLHRLELANLLAFSGPGVKRRYVSSLPAGICDVRPTLLHLMGIVDVEAEGRVLVEALADQPPPHEIPTVERMTASIGGYRQHLIAHRLGAHRYLDHGGRG